MYKKSVVTLYLVTDIRVGGFVYRAGEIIPWDKKYRTRNRNLTFRELENVRYSLERAVDRKMLRNATVTIDGLHLVVSSKKMYCLAHIQFDAVRLSQLINHDKGRLETQLVDLINKGLMENVTNGFASVELRY
ncbi:hypothetical protein EG68_11092 [Paragonimus skrjabini miyazakii]|uniref:Uncharacterized protein n=1 Tax=Paragonimus skrjabini miyazakii TaxID=59628 RepID=A0A8S9YCL9_9TREM|nr:hypothetical protein EG68_11092 [Paragonimus skrjabini miyazakii]